MTEPLPGMPADPHPECRHEWHGADGGACPACGWDSHPIPEVDADAAARDDDQTPLFSEGAPWPT